MSGLSEHEKNAREWQFMVELSTFIELLMTNDDDTKDLQKQVDGPQLQLGTEWRLRHA